MTERERLVNLIDKLSDEAVHKLLLFGWCLMPWKKGGKV